MQAILFPDHLLLPLKMGNGLFISSASLFLVIVDEEIVAYDVLANAAAERFGGIAREIPLNPDDDPTAQLSEEAKEKDYVVLVTYNAFCYPGQQKLQRALYEANPNKISSVTTGAAYDYDCIGEVPCCILMYEYTRLSIHSLIGVLSGEYKAEKEYLR